MKVTKTLTFVVDPININIADLSDLIVKSSVQAAREHAKGSVIFLDDNTKCDHTYSWVNNAQYDKNGNICGPAKRLKQKLDNEGNKFTILSSKDKIIVFVDTIEDNKKVPDTFENFPVVVKTGYKTF